MMWAPVERLAERAAVCLEVIGVEHLAADGPIGTEPGGLGGEGEEQTGDEEQRARVDRAGIADQRPHDQGDPDPGQEHRDRVGDGASDPGEGDLESRPGRPPVPSGIEDESHEERGRQQGEPDQVEVPLLELARSGAPDRSRLGSRRRLASGRLARRRLCTLARDRRLAPLPGPAAALLRAQKGDR
jgi:hypothetical protein